MANAEAKTINLMLYEGTLNGVMSMEDSRWNSGELYSAPRSSIKKLLETDACRKTGVYFLLSPEKVYVGQASDLNRRIEQHCSGKDWWESVLVLTTKDDSLTHTDIDYLEAVLIERARRINRLDCDNKNKGNSPKVDKYKKVFLDQYLEEALFLMQLIGVNVFNEGDAHSHHSLKINDMTKVKLLAGTRSKKVAIDYLKSVGALDKYPNFISKNVTYASLTIEKNEFFTNTPAKLVSDDWWLVLNRNNPAQPQELIFLYIPENTFADGDLQRRNDKQLDIHLNADTLVDNKSRRDFSKYIVSRVAY